LKALMGAVIFRRTRHTVLDLNWQPLEEVIKSLEFSAAERWAYNLALLEERNRIDASLPDHKGYSFAVIQYITQLRRLYNHGFLEARSEADLSQLTQSWNPGIAKQTFLYLLDTETAECASCGRNLSSPSAGETHQSLGTVYIQGGSPLRPRV